MDISYKRLISDFRVLPKFFISGPSNPESNLSSLASDRQKRGTNTKWSYSNIGFREKKNEKVSLKLKDGNKRMSLPDVWVNILFEDTFWANKIGKSNVYLRHFPFDFNRNNGVRFSDDI